jgi:hypothetical protein
MPPAGSWLDFMQDAALRAWGADRSEELRPALVRMAQALERVAVRIPDGDTVPENVAAGRSLRDQVG